MKSGEVFDSAVAALCPVLQPRQPDVKEALHALLASYSNKQQLHVFRSLFTVSALRACPVPLRQNTMPCSLLQDLQDTPLSRAWSQFELPLLLPPAAPQVPSLLSACCSFTLLVVCFQAKLTCS